LVAGFIFAELLNFSIKEKIYFATAISTAASMTKGTAEVHLEDIEKS
jgi:fructose-1-phosphate kinase PfkB-like protein